MSKLNPKP